MAKRSDFVVGDDVEHSGGAIGIVIKETNDALHVEFRRDGKRWTGIYDDVWFAQLPNGLRRIPPPAPIPHHGEKP